VWLYENIIITVMYCINDGYFAIIHALCIIKNIANAIQCNNIPSVFITRLMVAPFPWINGMAEGSILPM